jgi:hypothetical protein
MSSSRPIPDVLTPPARSLVLREQTGEFNHAALVEFPIEHGTGPVWDALNQWVLGHVVAVGLILADGPAVRFRREAKDVVSHEREPNGAHRG